MSTCTKAAKRLPNASARRSACVPAVGTKRERTPGKPRVLSRCDPSGIRTRVTAVRGRRTRPLYDGAARQPFDYAMAEDRGKIAPGEAPAGCPPTAGRVDSGDASHEAPSR